MQLGSSDCVVNGKLGKAIFLISQGSLSFTYLFVYLSTLSLGERVNPKLTPMMIKRHHYVYPIKIY